MSRSKRNRSFDYRADVPAATIWHDIVTVATAGTSVRAPISPDLRSLDIQNQHATANVFFGGSDVTNAAGDKEGQRLVAGATKSLSLSQAQELYFDSDTSSTVISLFGLVGHG